MNETFLCEAYKHGVYNHPGIGSTFSSRELLLREHAMTSLYWFASKPPLAVEMLQRGEQVIPCEENQAIYMKHYRLWGQHMKQAALEGFATEKGDHDYIMPTQDATAPNFHYPTIALDFIEQNYTPGVVVSRRGVQQEPACCSTPLHDRATVRVREIVSLLGVLLEHCRENGFDEYTLFLERAIFAVIALNPVLRLGMPVPFSRFVRSSVVSMAMYFYRQESIMRDAFKNLDPSYMDDLLECLGDLANLVPTLPVLSSGDFV